MNKTVISHAVINWSELGTPVSRKFNDVYFCNENALAESRHVSLAGNQLPERFYSTSSNLFTIAETGFGSGRHFLTTWHSFCQYRQQTDTPAVQQLHFISFEKYPLQLDDLIAIHQLWPELHDLAQQLQAQWPSAIAGCHRLSFDNHTVILDLWFGDINQTLSQLADNDNYNDTVDCWFLDGFAPAQNPEMWNTQLFDQIVKLTKSNGTFSTFTVAGFVRRGLQQAGFDVKKVRGFGHKRQMLAGFKPTPTMT